MPVVLVRVDDRLIHGQVVEGWIPGVKAQEVAVVSDAAAADETQSMLMSLAMPEGVKLTVLKASDAPAYLTAAAGRPERILVVAPGPQQVLGLLNAGVRLDHVNVGGLHYAAGRVQLGKAIFLGKEDRDALCELVRRGVRVEGRGVPGDAETDIVRLLVEGKR